MTMLPLNAIDARLLLRVPLPDRLTTMARGSALASSLLLPAQGLEIELTPIFEPAIGRTLQMPTMPPTSQALITPPFKVSNTEMRPALEERMREMINAERASQPASTP